MKSSFLTLNAQDFIKGLVVAVLSSVIAILYNTVQAGSLVFDWTLIATVALTSALGYIMKNLFTNSNDELMKKEI